MTPSVVEAAVAIGRAGRSYLRGIVAAAGMLLVLTAPLHLLASAQAPMAQGAVAVRPSFEVASVKRNRRGGETYVRATSGRFARVAARWSPTVDTLHKV